jgi:hypothetical protein
MAILFRRRECQEACECIARTQQNIESGSDDFTFNNLVVNEDHVITLIPLCYNDAVGFYFNAIISFASGVNLIMNKHYSWASVQLYYSVYYACRAILGFDKIIIVRKKGLFSLELKADSSANRSKDRNDHKMTLSTYKKKYNNYYLLTNKIDSDDFFDWIGGLREITNYRQQVFCEPSYLNIFNGIVSELNSGKEIGVILEKYSNNWDLYCFQEETAMIAGPYRLLADAAKKYKLITCRMTIQQRQYIKSLFVKIKCNSLISNLL